MKRTFLVSLGILVAACGSRLAAQSGGGDSSASPNAPVPSLASVYQQYFPIGAAVNPQTLVTQKDLLVAQVNSVVAENEMKWGSIHPRRGNAASSYNFYGADAVVAFAREHGMRVRGHTLVWHQQVPRWVFVGDKGPASRDEVLQRMQDHISTLLTRYKGQVYCWDVVNEALADDGTWRTDSPWYMAAGGDQNGDGIPDYIEKAFEFARQADPSARLFYNDYNIESGAKLDGAVALVKALKEKGLLDGVGIQGHWSIFSPDVGTVRNAIERFASLGVEVQITELDLSVYPWGSALAYTALPPEVADRQAATYAALFKVFRDESGAPGTAREGQAGKLTGVTFWGIADDHTWLDFFPVAGRKNWPLLFDTSQQPKPAFWAVAKW
ncbi:MAG TPA: endo-1,4-beta-xylanase [Spirochaetia bacterium]|nr:endo-1,4-beta-xylanase [Spirochaetia bacterium]